MGFKNNNYKMEKFGTTITIPAYAKIIEMHNGFDGYSEATFGIKANREAFDDSTIEYMATEKVYFQFDKKCNAYDVAYTLAKKQLKDEYGKVTHTYPFFGWQDDINY